jgi:hypothetical protein
MANRIRRRGSLSSFEQEQILTRDEVLVLLSEKARDGSTSAMIALERALRLHRPEDDELDAELDRLLSEEGD